jgi:hypothetical protein
MDCYCTDQPRAFKGFRRGKTIVAGALFMRAFLWALTVATWGLAGVACAAGATCANPDALGVGRVQVIDTTGGPHFGSQMSGSQDFLRDHEVVLTFDDGPFPVTTETILSALDAECTKATFFYVGTMALAYPQILKGYLSSPKLTVSAKWRGTLSN